MDSRLCFILALALGSGVSGFWRPLEPIGLDHKSTVFVPFDYDVDGAPDTFFYDRRVATAVAVDENQHIAYTIGMCPSVCLKRLLSITCMCQCNIY